MRKPRDVYETRVTHVRREPWRRGFTHRSSMWVVDVDRYRPSRRWAAALRGAVVPRDHLDGRSRSLREAVERFAEREGVALGDGPILLAAQPRVLGFCFNPISVWWSLDAAGRVATTVIEVHNTYGDRHAYVIGPDAPRPAQVAKAMYVSPFHGVDGAYEVTAPVPGDRIDVAVSLRTEDGARFSASLVGRRLDPAPWWTSLASPRDALRIRRHGLTLWACGLRVHPRPTHHQEALR